MKKLIAAAGIGAALAIAPLAVAGTASADSGYNNYRFLQGLNNNGIYAQPYPNAWQRLSTQAKILIGVAVAVVGVILITVLSGAAHGHGPQPFLNAVEDAGFYNRSGDSAALSHGYDVCEASDAGDSRASVVSQTYAANNLSRSSAEKFVDIAEDYLC